MSRSKARRDYEEYLAGEQMAGLPPMLFDEATMAVAFGNSAVAAANADPELGQALADVGLISSPRFRPKTGRRVLVKSRKVVRKWTKQTLNRLEEQAASGTLDLSPPPGAVPVMGCQLSGPGVELRSQVDSLVEEDKAHLARVGGIDRSVVVETPRGLIEFLIPYGSDAALLYALTQLFEGMEATAYVTVADAWMSTHRTDGPAPLFRPSEDPGRREVLVFQYVDRRRCEGWLVPYERTAEGIVFGETEYSDSSGGRWSKLLGGRAQ
jgi:hypothetical protein